MVKNLGQSNLVVQEIPSLLILSAHVAALLTHISMTIPEAVASSGAKSATLSLTNKRKTLWLLLSFALIAAKTCEKEGTQALQYSQVC